MQLRREDERKWGKLLIPECASRVGGAPFNVYEREVPLISASLGGWLGDVVSGTNALNLFWGDGDIKALEKKVDDMQFFS